MSIFPVFEEFQNDSVSSTYAVWFKDYVISEFSHTSFLFVHDNFFNNFSEFICDGGESANSIISCLFLL